MLCQAQFIQIVHIDNSTDKGRKQALSGQLCQHNRRAAQEAAIMPHMRGNEPVRLLFASYAGQAGLLALRKCVLVF